MSVNCISLAGRIPQSFIDDIVSRADIVEVIDAHVPLKPAGREYKACCPFHDEKTPSFTVNREKQFYHCFGCGAHGTVIGFLMSYRQLEFVEAVESLAQRLGLEVPREGGEPERPVQSAGPVFDILARASVFYQRQLREHPQRERAVDYLKSRGLSGEIAAEFKLGFAPPGWDNLISELDEGAGSRKRLREAGLVVERGDRSYDRFRDRIMFPILDRRGRTIGFGGRVLGDETPKYLNSPEGPVFHKGRELYGAYNAMRASRNLERILVVEGYMDVVALAQSGIRHAVATLGTAATKEHVEQLFRLAPDVVFCFDGDEAGRRAGWRALETVLSKMHDGRQAFFMFLPDGEDPDSLIRKNGRDAFDARAAGASVLSDFLFDTLVAKVDLETIEGRSRLVELARPLLGKIPPGTFGTQAIRRLEELARIAPGDSSTLIRGARRLTPRRQSAATVHAALASQTPVRRAIKMLVQQPRLASGISNIGVLEGLDVPGVPLLLELVELLNHNPNLSTAAILERYRQAEAGRHLANLAGEELSALGEGIQAEFNAALRALARQAEEIRLRARRSELEALIGGGDASAEEKQEYRSVIARLGRSLEDP